MFTISFEFKTKQNRLNCTIYMYKYNCEYTTLWNTLLYMYANFTNEAEWLDIGRDLFLIQK